MKKTYKLSELGLEANQEFWAKAHEAEKALDYDLCGELFYITKISDDRNGNVVVEYEVEY